MARPGTAQKLGDDLAVTHKSLRFFIGFLDVSGPKMAKNQKKSLKIYGSRLYSVITSKQLLTSNPFYQKLKTNKLFLIRNILKCFADVVFY